MREEAGIEVRLISPPALPPIPGPRQLARPEGIQLEQIAPGHEHIDLIYFVCPADPRAVGLMANHEVERVGWYGPDELDRIPLTAEVRAWIQKALAAAAERE